MDRLKNSRTGTRWISLIGIIVFCVTLDVLGPRINSMLGLPLYLDNTGIMLSALLGGYIPCITVGFLSNLVNGIFSQYSIYYCIISVLIAGIASLLAGRVRRMRFSSVLTAILSFAFLGGVIGGILTWLINGLSFGEGFCVDMAASIDKTIHTGYFASNMISCFVLDIVDKTISTTIALIIYKLVPGSLTDVFKKQDWYKVTILPKHDKSVVRRRSLRTKVTLVVALSTTLVAASAITICIIQYHNSIISEYTQQAEYSGRVVARHIEKYKIDDYLTKGRSVDGYKDIEELMQTVSDSSPEIQFVYVYRIEEDGTHVIFDLDTIDVPADEPGSVIEYDKTIKKYKDLFMRGEDIPMDITIDSDGWLLTSYAPIRGGNGKPLCYVGVDMAMGHLQSDELSFLAKIISLFLGVLIVIRTYAVWIAERHIIIPVNKIADAANRFSYDTPETREANMEMLNSIKIDTGDELEYLYNAYCRTTTDTAKFIDEIEHKNSQIRRMQDGLILVLADMVESRDKCTGDHVQKTAAYCDIILHQMQREGIYADEFNDEFINEVVSSAPLHDVGKIRISDVILNKPGKLTDEEFRDMKTHTTAGGEIIDKAIALVGEESEYLNEAKNLATCHHEKWDGTGYPAGLSGRDIPLAARVMAVADVFDALVSRRSYKQPYSFEKAVDIIREGSGSHFDPLVVQAFLHAKEEIYELMQQNLEL